MTFATTYTGNVLTLEIDAANRSGGWSTATAIDGLGIKDIGGFTGVQMRSSSGASWSLSSSELKAAGCSGASTAKGDTLSRICYTGDAIALADNMLFTFTFDGTPSLSAPHLKVHFVNANGSKTGSLLSMDFPWQAETIASLPIRSTGSTTDSAGSTGSTGGAQTGSGESQAGGATASPATEFIPAPVLTETGKTPEQGAGTLPVSSAQESGAAVPEPQTLAIIGAGLALMGITRRRKAPGKRA